MGAQSKILSVGQYKVYTETYWKGSEAKTILLVNGALSTTGVSVFLCSGWLGPAVRQALVLPARSGKSVSVQDRKLIHCHFPVVCRMTPVGGDVAQPKPYQFRRGLIGREVPSSLDDLA